MDTLAKITTTLQCGLDDIVEISTETIVIVREVRTWLYITNPIITTR